MMESIVKIPATKDNPKFKRFFDTDKRCVKYSLPLCLLVIAGLCFLLIKEYAKFVLFWVENQNPWNVFFTLLLLFAIVSFPVTVGYLVLLISSGYLLGWLKGIVTVVLGANLGVFIAHTTIKKVQQLLPVHKLLKNETGRAILRVISGPRAFKVVLFCRLTPIPFGLQNTIFGVSTVNASSYYAGTILGLLPAQVINVYLGSTLRSMHDVLNDHKTAFAGYSIFIVEVIIGITLMGWVLHKAKTELSEVLLNDIDMAHPLIVDIEV